MSVIDLTESETSEEISDYATSENKFESLTDIEAETRVLLSHSEPSEYRSNISQPRLSARKVKIGFFIGSRGSGKTTAMEEDAEALYNQYLTTLYIWASRSNENVFVGVNLNCKETWKNYFDKIDQKINYTKTVEERQKLCLLKEKMKNRLRCHCDKAYPINWLTPNYYNFKGVDEYNFNWTGKEEYLEAFKNNKILTPYTDLTLIQRDQLDKRKLRKPDNLLPKDHRRKIVDLIRICPFTIPNNAKNKEVFEKEFIRYLLEARKEHRWIIINPLMFLNENHKFSTVSYIIERLKFFADQYFQPMTPESVAKFRGVKQPVPKEEWTKMERSYDKIHLVLTEIRTLAPSNKYSPEILSSKTKRQLVDFASESRHFRISLTADLQNIDDLNSSIKPLSDYVVIKRSGRNLLGDEYGWFLDLIEKKRNEKLSYLSHGKYDDFKKSPRAIREMYKDYIDEFLPSVASMPTNKGFVVWSNNEYRLETFSMSRFHHKTEGETLQSVTNISWIVNEDQIGVGSTQSLVSDENDSSSGKRLKNYDEDKVKRFCVASYVESWDWKTVIEKLHENLANQNIADRLPTTGIENLDHKSISNRLRRDPELKQFLDFAKKNKHLPQKEILARLK